MSALGRPARRASARTSSLLMSPSGNQTRDRSSGRTPNRKYDWSLPRSRGPSEHDAAVRPRRDPRVVTGRQRRRADRVGEREQRPELELLVAAHARVRRPAGAVAGHELVDHPVLKRRALVDHVVGDAEQRRGRARVLDVARPAAAPADAGVGPARVVEPQRRPDDLVPALHQQRRGRRRIHAARHRDDDSLPAADADVGTQTLAARTRPHNLPQQPPPPDRSPPPLFPAPMPNRIAHARLRPPTSPAPATPPTAPASPTCTPRPSRR